MRNNFKALGSEGGKKKKTRQPEAETILDFVKSEMRIGFY